MDLQIALMIFIAVFALAIGFFLGLFLISLDAPFLKKLFPKEESEESTESVDKEPTTSTEEVIPAIPKPTPDSELMLRVWKEEGKPPVYEIDGEYIEKEALPKEILNYITVQEEIAQEVESVSPPEEVEEEPVVDSIQEPILEIDEDDESEVKMLSVVDEVNDILQRKLHGSPMAGKGIHLMENHNKEIRFWVGLESYNDVSEIPDPDVRKLIDDAVKEWEQNRE
jgi:hypothetical protein